MLTASSFRKLIFHVLAELPNGYQYAQPRVLLGGLSVLDGGPHLLA
jgi:hypothetical protein